MAISTYLYVIIFINGLNVPTKRHKLAERIQKQDPYICCLQETTSDLGTHTDLKWGDGRKHYMQMEITEKQE